VLLSGSRCANPPSYYPKLERLVRPGRARLATACIMNGADAGPRNPVSRRPAEINVSQNRIWEESDDQG